MSSYTLHAKLFWSNGLTMAYVISNHFNVPMSFSNIFFKWKNASKLFAKKFQNYYNLFFNNLFIYSMCFYWCSIRVNLCPYGVIKLIISWMHWNSCLISIYFLHASLCGFATVWVLWQRSPIGVFILLRIKDWIQHFIKLLSYVFQSSLTTEYISSFCLPSAPHGSANTWTGRRLSQKSSNLINVWYQTHFILKSLKNGEVYSENAVIR